MSRPLNDPRISMLVDKWRDGTCLTCGSATMGCDSSLAVEADNLGEIADYYVWCTNPSCAHWVGTCVGDQECPPAWANHERRNA